MVQFIDAGTLHVWEVYYLVVEIAPMINNYETVKERQAGRRENRKTGGKYKLNRRKIRRSTKKQ